MGWSVNPAIQGTLGEIAGVQPSTTAADTLWGQYFAGTNSLGATDPSIAQAGERGRDISLGKGINPESTNAGGGEQPFLTEAAKTRAGVSSAGKEFNETGNVTAKMEGEGERAGLTKIADTNALNIDKLKAESGVLSKGSKYVAPAWTGFASALLGGAIGGLSGALTPAPGGGELPGGADNPNAGYDYGYAGTDGGDGSLSGWAGI